MADLQIAEAAQLLRQRLKSLMKERGLKSQEELSDHLGISRGTIGAYFRPKKFSLPTPETLQKLRQKIPAITDEDAKILETAYSRKASQYRSRGSGKKASNNVRQPSATSSNSAPPQTTLASLSSEDNDARIGRLMRLLLSEVTQSNTTSDPKVLLSSQANERYRIGNMPYVLTKENFETIDISEWSESEQAEFLAYANLVLEEARKCMLLLAQFTPDQIRNELLEKLARNADLLWRTYKAALSVAPMEYVKDIDLAQKFVQL